MLYKQNHTWLLSLRVTVFWFIHVICISGSCFFVTWLCMAVSVCLFICLLRSIGSSPVWGLYEYSGDEHSRTQVCVDRYLHCSRVRLQSGLGGSYGGFIFWTFMKFLSCFSKQLYHFTFSPATYEVLVALHPCQDMAVFSVVAVLVMMEWRLMVLVCTSLMTRDVKHRFILLFCHIYVFFV